jgi:hypothetical protein
MGWQRERDLEGVRLANGRKKMVIIAYGWKGEDRIR